MHYSCVTPFTHSSLYCLRGGSTALCGCNLNVLFLGPCICFESLILLNRQILAGTHHLTSPRPHRPRALVRPRQAPPRHHDCYQILRGRQGASERAGEAEDSPERRSGGAGRDGAVTHSLRGVSESLTVPWLQGTPHRPLVDASPSLGGRCGEGKRRGDGGSPQGAPSYPGERIIGKTGEKEEERRGGGGRGYGGAGRGGD